MTRRLPQVLLWILLGVAVVLAPLACGSSDTQDAAIEPAPDSMTSGG